MSDIHNYDSDPRAEEFHFQVKGVSYTLREPPEDANIQVRSSQLKNAKLSGNKLNADVCNMIESQSLLVSLCTFTADDSLVGLKTVRSWGARVVKDLHERAQRMGNMTEGEAKNSPDDTPSSSE